MDTTRKTIRPGIRAGLSVLMAAGMLATACGSANSPNASESPTASTSASPSHVAKALPSNLCTALDVATVDSTLGLKVDPGIWDGSHNCVWVSTNPHGGLTLDRIDESMAVKEIAAGKAQGATTLSDLGQDAVGTARTGLAAPVPPSDALIVVDLGTVGLSIHASGPAITLVEAVKIAHDVLG